MAKMSTTTHLSLLLAVLAQANGDNICKGCDCLPAGPQPTQAICLGHGSQDTVLSPDTHLTRSLELIFMYGLDSVKFTDNSLDTEKPLTLLIQNCTEVVMSDRAATRLRTLLIRDADKVQVGEQSRDDLWATVLEDIQDLTVSSAVLIANYSVSINHIGSLTLQPSVGEVSCNDNPDFMYSMYDSNVKPVPKQGLSVCGGHITIKRNTFQSVAEGGFQITSDGHIEIADNKFKNFSKEGFILTSPQIYISNNHFENLPAGALRGVSSIHDTYFTNNTIADIDLGGVLLDMGWDMVVEHNTVDCDCASKRTSILNPKQDMLYLTNSSLEKLNAIFHNNVCNLNCTITLQQFSYALKHDQVCINNYTQMEEVSLCGLMIVPDTTTTVGYEESSTLFHNVTATASRLEVLLPLTIIIVTILITSSLCYGCREINAFRFTFNPNRVTDPKVSLQY